MNLMSKIEEMQSTINNLMKELDVSKQNTFLLSSTMNQKCGYLENAMMGLMDAPEKENRIVKARNLYY